MPLTSAHVRFDPTRTLPREPKTEAKAMRSGRAQMRRGNDGRSDFTGAADFAQGGRRAQIVSRLHWLFIAIMTLRAAACRLVISGR